MIRPSSIPIARLAILACLILSVCYSVDALGQQLNVLNAEPSKRPQHVFIIVLENEGFKTTFGRNSPAPYLSRELASKGLLLRQYYGIGHFSLDNYIAMISGQSPNP